MWLHNIEYKTLEETTSEIRKYQNKDKEYQLEKALVFYYDFDIQLNILCNCETNWTNTESVIKFRAVHVIDYINYLHPSITITGKDIITTIIAREQTTTQHILDTEIVSVGEFHPFYTGHQKRDWSYVKEIQELHRAKDFSLYHNYDISKSVNYCD